MKRKLLLLPAMAALCAPMVLSAPAYAQSNTYNGWHATPVPTVSATPLPAPSPTVKVLASVNRTINKVTYTVAVNQQNLGTNIDGYAVVVRSATKTYLNLQLTKTEAQHIITLVKTYKPSSLQMLIARIAVFALF